MQIGGGPTNELLPLCGPKEHGKTAEQTEQQGQRLLGHLIGKESRGAGDQDGGPDDLGSEAVIHAGGRRLDPPQSAVGHDLIPGHRPFLGMAAEHVRVQDGFGDLLLLGRHDLRVWGDGGDLPEVPLLDGVTENDAHGCDPSQGCARTCVAGARLRVVVTDYRVPHGPRGSPPG